jgi:uncharacterized protein YbcI
MLGLSNSKGHIEAQICEAIIKFEKEYMGRGPIETKTYIIEDMIIVRLKGVITRAEHHLATSGDSARGRELIKQTRMELIEKARPLLESVIESIAGSAVVSLHTDISTRTGERVIIFTLEKEPFLENSNRSRS